MHTIAATITCFTMTVGFCSQASTEQPKESTLSINILHIRRVEGWLNMAEEAYEAALRQALEELTEVHQDAFSFV